MTETRQDLFRELLVRVTGWIPNESAAGLVFGIALVVSDHLFNLGGK